MFLDWQTGVVGLEENKAASIIVDSSQKQGYTRGRERDSHDQRKQQQKKRKEREWVLHLAHKKTSEALSILESLMVVEGKTENWRLFLELAHAGTGVDAICQWMTGSSVDFRPRMLDDAPKHRLEGDSHRNFAFWGRFIK